MKNVVIIDFTRYRKGSKPDGRHVIDLCPKCNRKGEKHEAKSGKFKITTYIHQSKFTGSFFYPTDSCFI